MLIRTSLLGAGSLWLDELWTLDAISRSFKEMVGARLVSDQHPPLWSVLSWIWLRVVGTYDPGTMRLLPLGFGLAVIGAPLLGAARLRSLRPTLLVMAALLALSLLPLQYAVELRSYSMMMAFGTAATVVWAGLLSGDLPRRGSWIFLFTLTGALAGFSHYYGHLLYGAELGVLIAAWARARPRRPLATLVGWAALSLVPVAVWVVLTSRWFPVRPVAEPPSVEIIQTWLAYGLGPVSNLLANHPPGYAYPAGPLGVETTLFALSIAVIALMFALGMRARLHRAGLIVGAWSCLVLVVGLGGAWVGSVELPPSMNARNLAALLPLLLLVVASAVTSARAEKIRWLAGSATVAAWFLATLSFTASYGVNALAPPWQQQAGYRAAADALLAASSTSTRPILVGLDTFWGWHGQWEAALRATVGSRPAQPGDPAPIQVRWVGSVDDVKDQGLPEGPVVIFSDSLDQREADLIAWVQESRGPCERTTFGGPGFGAVVVVECPG